MSAGRRRLKPAWIRLKPHLKLAVYTRLLARWVSGTEARAGIAAAVETRLLS